MADDEDPYQLTGPRGFSTFGRAHIIPPEDSRRRDDRSDMLTEIDETQPTTIPICSTQIPMPARLPASELVRGAVLHGCSDGVVDLPAEYRGLTSSQREALFREQMLAKGLVIEPMASDGNCLFRAIARQVFADPEQHDILRERCLDHMESNREHFSPYVSEDYSEYIRRKRRLGCFGNNLEIQAMAELFGRPIQIYSYGAQPINLFHSAYNTDAPPLMLSYHNANHYNAVINPENPCIGIGLGIGIKQPAEVESEMMDRTIAESDALDAEQALEQQALDESRRKQAADEQRLLQDAIHASQMDEKRQVKELMNRTRSEYEDDLVARAIAESHQHWEQDQLGMLYGHGGGGGGDDDDGDSEEALLQQALMASLQQQSHP
mmetsp:Transcript_15464/g.39476  ORF Transcript_15464/g.39476 Transcript_15464/m.39476 type:complete len:379 (-) Transcript_15464:319-1455(-)|eukprot:CAMPEP_0174234578 /NCGR_PEP_ID=MMETSP0417-20130205/4291_1 /TAXON_ID=242541 /ORGANISM="Mayorella sp, Strain BSH-02190019" /LENGTH=378 /DNA_ID=CAMNT_0015312959 /DNA_START=111 /DNA_END=1247 /DNA_ORIENTATION=+